MVPVSTYTFNTNNISLILSSSLHVCDLRWELFSCVKVICREVYYSFQTIIVQKMVKCKKLPEQEFQF